MHNEWPVTQPIVFFSFSFCYLCPLFQKQRYFLTINTHFAHCSAVTGGGGVGECTRLSQSSWLLSALIAIYLFTLIYNSIFFAPVSAFISMLNSYVFKLFQRSPVQPTCNDIYSPVRQNVHAYDCWKNTEIKKWNKMIIMLPLLQMTKRILEARCNVQNMTSLDAKMTYIRAWQRLAASGTAYFIVMFKGSKKKVH